LSLACFFFVQNAFAQTDTLYVGVCYGKGEKILLINFRNKEIKMHLPAEAKNAIVHYVDASTGENVPAEITLKDADIMLKPFTVDVVGLN
jgi:hypothetical protein